MFDMSRDEAIRSAGFIAGAIVGSMVMRVMGFGGLITLVGVVIGGVAGGYLAEKMILRR